MGIMQAGKHNNSTVTRAEFEPRPGKSDQVVVGFENEAGDYITAFLSLSDAAFKYTTDKLRACGWTGTDVSDLSECIGKRVNLAVADEEYNGKTSPKVKSIYSATRKAIDPVEAKSAAAKYAARFAAVATPPADPRPEPPPNTDDLLPF